MDILQIKKADAIKAYKSADPNGRVLLDNLFGNQLVVNVIERVKTFDDILAIKGITLDELINDDVLSKDELAYRKAKLIAEVYNNGVTLEWSNSEQTKYSPWFKWKSGFGLACSGYDDRASGTVVGSRLCFKSADLAIDAGQKFTEIYNDLLN